MTLTAGILIGRYEIGPLLGAGGMGEVYRARDTQLGRDVAIKILPELFAADPATLERFEREARATAALNHPGVLCVHDAGVHAGKPYLVTELLDGMTLRAKIEAERLPMATTLRYASEILAALAAAHDKGIVHRDIKLENIFVTSADTIKILDFGLAKLTLPLNDTIAGMTHQGTLPNVLLGTLGYLAPEQARGQPVDHRADIFSFGCVLFELLEGSPAFVRDTPADTITAILKEPPRELTASANRSVPPALNLILQRCLEKEPAARFQSTNDLAFAVTSFARGNGGDTVRELPPPAVPPPAPPPPAHPTRRLGWIAGSAVAVAVAAAVPATFWLGGRSAASSGEAVEFLVPPPAPELSFASAPLAGLDPTAPLVGISPDGRTVAFVAVHPSGSRKLWIRSLDNGTPRAVDGTDDVSSWPFWSSDGRFIAFAAHGILWKAEPATHAIERLCSLPDQGPAVPFVTGAWDDGSVVFSIGPDGLYRVPAIGGRAERFTTLDKTRRDNYHSWPQILPGKRLMMFVRTDDAKTTGMYAGSSDAQDFKLVTTTASRAVYARERLLWMIDDRVVSQAFDANTLALSGKPSVVVPSVFQGAGRTPAFWASNTGALVYAVGGNARRQFRWFSRTGEPLETVGPPGMYGSFDVSGDGGHIVAETRREIPVTRSTLVLLDASRDVAAALTTGELNDTDPRFGPSGDVAFARNTGDTPGIVRINRAGGETTLLVPRGKAPVVWLEDWAGANGGVIYRSALSPDAWQVVAGGPARQLTKTSQPVEQVQLSPNGKWIAYNNADSGRAEVYLSLLTGGRRWQISDAGGVQGIWRADGRELYYLGLDGGMYAVDVRDQNGEPEPSKPRLLFRSGLPVISAVVEQYRVAPDGSRFLFCVPLTSVQQEPLRVVLNWPAKLVPE